MSAAIDRCRAPVWMAGKSEINCYNQGGLRSNHSTGVNERNGDVSSTDVVT